MQSLLCLDFVIRTDSSIFMDTFSFSQNVHMTEEAKVTLYEINIILITVSLNFSNDPKIKCENYRAVVSRPTGTRGDRPGRHH